MPLKLDEQMVLENKKNPIESREANLTLTFSQLEELIELLENAPNEIPKSEADRANWWAKNTLWGKLVEARKTIQQEIMRDAMDSIAKDRIAGR